MGEGRLWIPEVPEGAKVRFHPEAHRDPPFRDLEKLRSGRPLLEQAFEQALLRLLLCFTGALRALERWPPTPAEQATLAETLGLQRITCNNCDFYRGRFEEDDLGRIDRRLIGHGELHFYFWPSAADCSVWVLHTRWSRSDRITGSVNRRVARRLHQIRGWRHDEGMDVK